MARNVRHGVACEVRVCIEPVTEDFDGEGVHYLKLTEFPDPEGKCVYFRLRDLSVAVPDELLHGRMRVNR